MGRVPSSVVEATFFNFAPAFVQRWVPDVWQRALSRSAPPRAVRGGGRDVDAAVPRRGTRRAPRRTAISPRGRQLCRRRATAVRGEPRASSCRTIRSPRSGSCARRCASTGATGTSPRSTAAGLDGIEAHVLIALEHAHDPEDLQRTRGWTGDDWALAVERCRSRQLVDAAGRLDRRGPCAAPRGGGDHRPARGGAVGRPRRPRPPAARGRARPARVGRLPIRDDQVPESDRAAAARRRCVIRPRHARLPTSR